MYDKQFENAICVLDLGLVVAELCTILKAAKLYIPCESIYVHVNERAIGRH